MAHTPSAPASDDRPLRFLERADVPEAHRERLLEVVRAAQRLVAAAGLEGKFQCEFGAEHAGLIHDCNQFVRLYKRGPAAGRVELFLQEEAKAALRAAGFTLHAPQGQVFRLFGWVAVDPTEGDPAALERAVAAAYARVTGRAQPPAPPAPPPS